MRWPTTDRCWRGASSASASCYAIIGCYHHRPRWESLHHPRQAPEGPLCNQGARTEELVAAHSRRLPLFISFVARAAADSPNRNHQLPLGRACGGYARRRAPPLLRLLLLPRRCRGLWLHAASANL